MAILERSGHKGSTRPHCAVTGHATVLWCSRLVVFRVSIIAFVVAICLAAISVPCSYAKAPSEYQVKSAFLYNFAQFVEWPAQSFPDASSPLVIGVLGEDQFVEAIDQISKGKTVGGRRLVTKLLNSDGNLDTCHILFISSTEKRRIGSVLDRLKDSSILIVGETNGFVQSGGVIGFLVQDNKVGFDINAGAAKRKHLKISSQLLRLARNVKD